MSKELSKQNEDQSQEQQAIVLLKEMLIWINARDLRENLNKLFYGYLSSEEADSVQMRNTMSCTHSNLVEFLTKVSKLPEIDCRDRN